MSRYPEFKPGDAVFHHATPEVHGVVKAVRPGEVDETPLVKVEWPDGSPVELHQEEHPAKSLGLVVFPVCENCGERHEAIDPEEAVAMAKTAVVIEAVKVAQAMPGMFPRLERALAIGQAAAREIEIRKFAEELSKAPETEEPKR